MRQKRPICLHWKVYNIALQSDPCSENGIGIFTEVGSNVLQLPSNDRRQAAHGWILLVEQITIKIAGEATEPLQCLEQLACFEGLLQNPHRAWLTADLPP